MKKKKRFKTPEEEIEAIRREPAFRALVEDLKSQEAEDQDRLHDWLSGEHRKEEANGQDDKEDS
jgi:hypothetical protein